MSVTLSDEISPMKLQLAFENVNVSRVVARSGLANGDGAAKGQNGIDVLKRVARKAP